MHTKNLDIVFFEYGNCICSKEGLTPSLHAVTPKTSGTNNSETLIGANRVQDIS